MGKIFNTQDYVRIELAYTDATISGDIASVKIKWSNRITSGEWVATHDAVSKTVFYDMPVGEYLTVLGGWKFWIEATMTDDRILPGEVHEEIIHAEGG